MLLSCASVIASGGHFLQRNLIPSWSCGCSVHLFVYLLLLIPVLISLGPLVKKVGKDRVVEMTTKLCDKLLDGKDQHRDTASIALRTLIVEVTITSLAENILVSLAPQLINGVTSVSF